MKTWLLPLLLLAACGDNDELPAPELVIPAPAITATCGTPVAALEQVWAYGKWIVRGVGAASCTGNGGFVLTVCLQQPSDATFVDVQCVKKEATEASLIQDLHLEVPVALQARYRLLVTIIAGETRQEFATDVKTFAIRPAPGQT